MSASPPRGDLTRGPVGRQLLALAGPTLAASLAVVATQVVDTWFLGRCGPQALTAAGYAFPVLLGVVALGMSLASGAAAVVAKELGEGRRAAAATRARHAVSGATFAGAALAILVVGGSRLLPPGAAGAEGGAAYIAGLGLAAPWILLGMTLSALHRAAGDAATPARAMVGLALVNLALAPLFIVGVAGVGGWGVRGAAATTAVAWLVGTLGMAASLRAVVGDWEASGGDAEIPSPGDSARQLARVAVPASLARMARPAGVAWVTALAAHQGPDVVAAYAVGGRLQALLALPALALAAAVLPFLAQNAAAGEAGRVRRALAFATTVVACAGFLAWGGAALWREAVAQSFASEPGTQASLRHFLWLGLAGLPLEGVTTVCKASFHALDRSLWTLGLGVAQVALTGVLGTIGVSQAGSPGLFLGLAVAQWLVGFAAVLALTRSLRP